ncbi:bifunctional 5,10-methylenetetrahydrofolate dehydrogenase/5,10-methenyltetrahydrofolate cyclohydrolase [Fusibacter sp. JL298sf-3]
MIIDGSLIAKEMRNTIKEKRQHLSESPKVVAFIVGDNPSSLSYLKMLEKSCKGVGFEYELRAFEVTVSQEVFVEAVEAASADNQVNGILVQMPLPPHIEKEAVIGAIDPKKDVDGFHPMNAGLLFQGKPAMAPCTPRAVMVILEKIGVGLAGKNVVVIGRSNVVGKPLAVMLTHQHATVTLCHSKTKDIEEHTRRADIVVVAVGRAHFLTADMVSEDAIVIDVGMNALDGKLVGDCDYEALVSKVKGITPVPGGVGPVTNAVLLTYVMDQFEGV